MKKKKTETTNQTTAQTVTPTNPQFVTDGVSSLAGRIGDTFKGLDPFSLVPGANTLQQQAAAGAAGLSSSPAQETLNRVSNVGPSTVQAGDIAGGIQGFMSPYTNDVVNTSLADYDHGAGLQTAQANLDVAGDATFSGSGGSLRKALLGGELARGRGTLSAGLRDQGFTRASDLAARQAEMGQQASLANATLAEQALSRQAGAATAAGADNRANIGAQADIGAILRQIAAAQAGAPITALGQESALFGGLPLDLFRGQNATGSLDSKTKTVTSGMDIGQLAKLAAAAGLAFVPGGQGAAAALAAS